MKAVKTLFLLTLFGIGFLFSNYALAATEVTGGCCDTTIVFNNPEPDQSYNIGDTINFSGRFKVTSCADGLFFNKVTFYITEDKEIPTTNCCGDTSDVCRTGIENCSCPEGCQNCYGATSETYTHCRFRRCDEVRILDLNKSKSLGYKVYKLGTVYPADVAQGAKPYWVEYNQSFIIPSDLGFSGPVRFYVQYSGTHWASHWHWHITYQKGKIITYPDIPTELSESWNDCTFEQLSVPTFRWKYSHPDNISQAGYQIKIYGEGTLDITTDSPSTSYTPLPVWVRDNLLFGEKTYYWQVRVKDNYGNWSDWSDFKEFKTRRHPYPWIDFTWSPSIPSVDQITQFCAVQEAGICPENVSTCYDINNNPISCSGETFLWTFPAGTKFATGTSATSENPRVKFDSTGQKVVSLQITDDIGTCSITKQVGVTFPLPEWEEAAP